MGSESSPAATGAAPAPASIRDREASAFFSLGVAMATATAVTARIRAAIDLGLLGNGDALPKEAELARQLEVTVFTVREALAQLRAEGLVVTRVGRGGGSFVHRAPERTDTLVRSQLTSMSSGALRDLGDWRSMLAGESADLASTRASSGNVERLAILAEQVRTGDPTTARRASARFRVELAASAQSLRMSAADVALHEEFGALIGLPLQEAEFRKESARLLDDVVDAVRRHDVRAARAAALAESRHTIDALLRMRLRLLAPRTTKGDEPEDRLSLLAARSWALPGRVLDAVRRLAAQVGPATSALLADEDPDPELSELHRAAAKALQSAGRHVQGMGVMFSPGVIPRHPFGGAWVTRRAGLIAPSPHPSDPQREDFYDYSMAEWMTIPRRSGDVAIVGPFVDYGGADDYILTISAPVLTGDLFVGVAAADVLLAEYEIAIAPELSRVNRACSIVNAEGRIVVSNDAEFAPGALVPDDRVTQRLASGGAGWSVVVLD